MALLSDPNRRDDPPRPLLEHLLALRDMFIFGGLAWFICAVVAGVFSNDILAWLQYPLTAYAEQSGTALAAKGPVDGVSICLSIALWGGTALSFPFLALALLRFVFPALTRREKALILTVLIIGTGFFIAGTYLAYRETLPLMLNAFRRFNDWMGMSCDFYFAADYVPVILKTLVAFGLVFQLPLALFLAGWFGLVTSTGLRSKRRHAIVFAFVLSMLLTPPDPMSQIVMAVPLCLLYEVAIWAVWLKERVK